MEFVRGGEVNAVVFSIAMETYEKVLGVWVRCYIDTGNHVAGAIGNIHNDLLVGGARIRFGRDLEDQ